MAEPLDSTVRAKLYGDNASVAVRGDKIAIFDLNGLRQQIRISFSRKIEIVAPATGRAFCLFKSKAGEVLK